MPMCVCVCVRVRACLHIILSRLNLNLLAEIRETAVGQYNIITLKMEAIVSSETKVTTYKTARRHDPGDSN
jgi:hypothetical protein